METFIVQIVFTHKVHKKIKKHEKVCNNHGYCYVEMSDEGDKILKFNYGENSLKAPFMIYADLECLIEKIHSCQKNPEKSYTENKTKHTFSGYFLFTNCLFDLEKHKLHSHKGKDLRQGAIETFNYEKQREMIPLTNEENEYYEMEKVCCICKKFFDTDKNDENTFKLYHKVRDHCHYTGKFRGTAHSICNSRYKTPKNIRVVFHNDSTYDYHFIFNQLAKEFDGQLECLVENTEKYITFSVPISTKVDNGKTVTYKLKLIDSFRFMLSKLLDLIDNLSEKIHSAMCTYCKSCLDHMTTKDDKLIFRCFDCKKSYQKGFNKDLTNIFANNFVTEVLINLFCYEGKVLIRMNTWIVRKNMIKHPCLIKKYFCSELYLERHY